MARSGPVSDYVQWKRDSLVVGCMFARLIAGKRDEFKQKIVTIGAASPAGIAASASRQISKMSADEHVDAACLLFPNITELGTLAAAALLLGEMPGWHISKTAMKHQTEGDLVALGLTFDIPSRHCGVLPSEALVFGKFPIFPKTRQSPVCALEIFVGDPLQFDPKDDVTPATRANLAHMLTPQMSPAARGRMLNKSGRARRQSLELLDGQDDLRAKAKVSLVIPADLARAMGCEP